MKYWETPDLRRDPRENSPSTRNGSGGHRRSISSGGDLRQYPFLRTFYQHQAVISGGLQKFLFFLFIAAILYFFVLGDAGAIRIMALKKERAQLRAEVSSVQVDIAKLQKEIDRLKNDSFMMEKLGRERYGYAAPGDQVIKLVPSKKNTASKGEE
jgi:cell division protein FtsB